MSYIVLKSNKKGDHMFQIGQMAIIGMISHVLFIYITWRLIITINFDFIVNKNNVTEAKALLFFVTIVIGTGVSRFFLELLQWSQDLLYLF